ncbi:uncharacterized protein LOC127701995 [Mytilus californianus]|uniref:uncharacterized protein LOC127701995 n=1 Tax=Mytilus californianus TaxID=6549 RepID=UPI002245EBED|nr:uncharacterized protein LOC127701995 [Mytilus californianus]
MKMTILFVFLSICFWTYCFAEDNHKHTGHNESDPYDTIFAVGLLIPNCKVQPVDPELRSKLNIMLSEGKKLIFIHLEFEDHKNLESKSHQGDIYKPLDWIRTYGRHGRSLLYLRPQFEHLSLTTLSFNTEHIDVRLKQTPTQCLTRHNLSTIEDNLRRLLVMDFKMNLGDDHAVENEKICNVEVKNEQSIVAFKYVCCWHGHSKVNEHLECKNISSDYWMEILFTCIFLIKVLVLMFCPLLIPASLYRKKYTETVYEHVLSKPIELRIKKIIKDDKSKLTYLNVPSVEMNQLKNMQDSYEWNRVCKLKKFYETMKTVPINKVLTISLRKLDIVVRYDRLVPSNYVPVGILQVVYSLFVKCHIRKSPSFQKCCRSSIFGFQWLFGKKAQTLNIDEETDKVPDDEMQTSTIQPEDIIKYPWHRCLRQTMRLLLILAISVPWALRVYFYYEYEDSEASDQKKAAEVRNLTLPALKWSLTYTLTPLHPMFILCYAVIITDAIVFALVSPRIKKKLQSLMRRSMRDMRQISKIAKIKGSIVQLLIPCEICGIVGLIIYPLYFIFALPIILISLAFYCVPTINVTIRLLAHFLAYLTQWSGMCNREALISCKKRCGFMFNLFHLQNVPDKTRETVSCKNRLLQLFVLPMCLITIFALVLLTMETIIFFVEMILYTVIGIIMNSSDMLKYITLVFMLGLYARNCFKGISEKYLKFNQTINSLIVESNRSQVEAIASECFEEQKNTAFQITTNDEGDEQTNENDTNVRLIVSKDGIPKWSVRKLILFLDRQDQPYLTEKFFFSTCYMDTVGAPGPLIPNIIHAVWRFMCICAFLMFVVLIVLAFGDEYNISGANQMLATLAGGLLPWVFENVLFSGRDPLELDTNNLSFKSNFKTKIDQYVQSWDIHDIDIDENRNRNDNVGDSHSVTARLIDKVNDAVMTTLENESGVLLGEPPKQSIGFYKDNDDRRIDFLVIEKPSKMSNV